MRFDITSEVVDDPRSAGGLESELAERDQILDEQVWLILARAIAGSDPGVPLGDDMASDRRSHDRARARIALDPMREDN